MVEFGTLQDSLICSVSEAHGKGSKKHTVKRFFAMCYIFVVFAHDKKIFCHVPYRKHTANYRAHVKEPDSSSGSV